MAAWFDKIKLTPYVYDADGKVVAEMDLGGFLPLPWGARLRVQLLPAGGQQTRQTVSIDTIPADKRCEAEFSLKGLAAGKHEIKASLLGQGTEVISQAPAEFADPRPAAAVPAPAAAAPPLPEPPKPLPYTIVPAKGGGFVIQAKGETYAVVSSFAYPEGGENELAGGDEARGEPEWQPRVKNIDPATYEMEASGKHYCLRRAIKLHPNRISIKDTFANSTAEPVGIIVRNKLNAGGMPDFYLGGNKGEGDAALSSNPTVFARKTGLGFGLVALDDVFTAQIKGFAQSGQAGLYTDCFALDKGASWTLEWAIYLNGTGDYYDFINEVRQDEGRNNATIEGGHSADIDPKSKTIARKKGCIALLNQDFLVAAAKKVRAKGGAIIANGVTVNRTTAGPGDHLSAGTPVRTGRPFMPDPRVPWRVYRRTERQRSRLLSAHARGPQMGQSLLLPGG